MYSMELPVVVLPRRDVHVSLIDMTHSCLYLLVFIAVAANQRIDKYYYNY